jgi:stage II sporulation protein M
MHSIHKEGIFLNETGRMVGNMASKLRELLSGHIRNNINKYFLLSVTFATGVAAGAFAVNGLSSIQRHELTSYLDGFLDLMDGYSVKSSELLRLSVLDNAKLVVLLWILGVSIIGIPFIFLAIGIKGFITGFSSGFIIKMLGIKGVLFSVVGFLTKEIIIVPCIIALGVNGINFSMNMISNRSIKNMIRNDLKTNFAAYSAAVVFYSGILFTGILFEAYVTPVLIRIVAPIIKG